MLNKDVVLLVFKNDQKPDKCALWFIINNYFSARNIHFLISLLGEQIESS